MMLHKKCGFVHKYPLCHCNNGAHRQGGLNALMASLKSCMDSFEWIKREFVLILWWCICIISVRQMSLIGCGLCLRRTEDVKKLTGLPEQKGAGWCKVRGGRWGAGAQTRTFLSSYYTMCLQPKRLCGSYRGQSHHDGCRFPEAPGQMPSAADENLTYCSKTAGEMHNIL